MQMTEQMFVVTAGDETQTVPASKAMDVAGEMYARTGKSPTVTPAPAPAPVYSGFGDGNQVMDPVAKARIEAQYDVLEAAGVKGIAREKTIAGYVPGTRMAQIGYENQARRAAEHRTTKQDFVDAAGALAAQVRAEQREDVVLSAGEFASAIEVNGKVTMGGFAITERAIRGLMARLEAPALTYVLGLRERIAEEVAAAKTAKEAGDRAAFDAAQGWIRADKAQLADTLAKECRRYADVPLKVRRRGALKDIFAIVSPSYSAADAPEVIDQVVDALPDGAKGTFAYDPTTTAWELRAHVWTPTPVAQQAVGEPFEGYAAFSSRDNGTAKFRGSGGITILACLNAGTYTIDETGAARSHVGKVLYDVQTMMRDGLRAVNALCDAWGVARKDVVEAPKGVSLEEAIPGFYRYLLTDRRSMLAGVLPGRSEVHARALAETFRSERRDHDRLVRADFAQGWTKYIQGQEPEARRNAEAAIGEWMVRGGRIGCALPEKAA
jgi:hypothetical protein